MSTVNILVTLNRAAFSKKEWTKQLTALGLTKKQQDEANAVCDREQQRIAERDAPRAREQPQTFQRTGAGDQAS